jgi:hypothetical protein
MPHDAGKRKEQRHVNAFLLMARATTSERSVWHIWQNVVCCNSSSGMNIGLLWNLVSCLKYTPIMLESYIDTASSLHHVEDSSNL